VFNRLSCLAFQFIVSKEVYRDNEPHPPNRPYGRIEYISCTHGVRFPHLRLSQYPHTQLFRECCSNGEQHYNNRRSHGHEQTGGTVFSLSAITVKSGSFVKIVNRTAFSRIVFADRVVRIAPGAAYLFVPAQSMIVGICGGTDALSITVV
jgi:hypothetical protein